MAPAALWCPAGSQDTAALPGFAAGSSPTGAADVLIQTATVGDKLGHGFMFTDHTLTSSLHFQGKKRCFPYAGAKSTNQKWEEQSKTVPASARDKIISAPLSKKHFLGLTQNVFS